MRFSLADPDALHSLKPRVLQWLASREDQREEADATDASAVRSGLGGRRPDVVVSDFPYGRLTHWRAADPASRILAGLHDVLADEAQHGSKTWTRSFPRRTASARWKSSLASRTGKLVAPGAPWITRPAARSS